MKREDHHTSFCEDERTEKILMNTRVLFGLEQQGHIPLIEQMLKQDATWEEIGKTIGWHPPTVKEHYGWYLEKQQNLMHSALEGEEEK